MAQHTRRTTELLTPTRVLVGVLLALPFLGTLWVSSYSRVEPRLGGFPFFYWYQFLWIFLSAILTTCAFVLVQRERRGQQHRTPQPRRKGGAR
ncbi:DUF3311 domain-containing protein [Actinopolymorpha alba]|uniref:DUF3311 domain-containing protein n=1 Tax=Actinopolymorpha alba TaxID=533267 RepID=UPI000686BEB4|nr:DUF3311 domain-containing protein [Actinopolymorpha alba]